MLPSKVPSQEANSKVPGTITQLFIDGILALPQTPKSEYLKSQFLSKFVSSETDSAELRRSRAIEKWLATEERNAETNQRLDSFDPEYHILPRVPISDFVSFAQRVIHDILGDVPENPIGAFSGGASTSRTRTSSHPALKYLGQADITQAAMPWFQELIEEMPGWLADNPITLCQVKGNVLFTVPKKADIDRCACKEPDINMFMQKSLGTSIRKRLRKVNIDLNDQSINANYARIGSKTGSLATLDLSSASDSVCTRLVELMLPPIWFSVMNALRCEFTIIDGHEHRNEMFSSMGNGFTFELESLLFYALARTTAYFEGIKGVISVYGDDIICPTALYPSLVWVLKYFGFSTNVDKSFAEGPFRESCGGHFLNGYDITPFYLRAPITRLTDLIHMANSLREWARVSDGLGILDSDCWPLWSQLRDLIPKGLWGGRDTSFKYSLVSVHSPRGCLRERVRQVSNGTGGYYHWLNITWRREHPGDVQTSSRSLGLHSFRIKPAHVVNSNIDLFLEELDVPSKLASQEVNPML